MSEDNPTLSVDTAPVRDRAAREAALRVADYEHGWHSDIEQEFGPKGLSEDTVRFISAKKKSRNGC